MTPRNEEGNLVLWEPLPDLPKIDSVDALMDDWEGFRILLRATDLTKPMLRVRFEAAMCYRSMEESYFLNGYGPIPEDWFGKTFFKVEDSSFLSQFHEISSRVYEDWNITHFGIYAPNDCIDVLATSEPSVEWLES